MKQFHGMSLYLAVSIFWLATGAIAGEAGTVTNQPAVSQESGPKSGSTPASSASKEKTAKKSNQGDVNRAACSKRRRRNRKVARQVIRSLASKPRHQRSKSNP